MRSSEKYLRLYVQSKYWKGSGLKFRCSLEGIPSFFCTQLVSIFPSWDELCFSLNKFFVLGLNQHCILNRLLCLHFKSPLGCYSCYLDGFYSVCYAHWPHQNKWLSRELDYKAALSVDAHVWIVSQYFFFFLLEVIIIPGGSAVPSFRGRLRGLWKILRIQPDAGRAARTAFCLSSGSTHTSPCGLCSLRKNGSQGTAAVRIPNPGDCGLHSEGRSQNPTKCQSFF